MSLSNKDSINICVEFDFYWILVNYVQKTGYYINDHLL